MVISDIEQALQAELRADTHFLALCDEAAQRAADIEVARALPADLARRLQAANLCCMFLPREIGGVAYSPLEAMLRLEYLARYDAATAWVCMIGSTAALGAAYIAPDISKALFVGDSRITCGIFAPNGVAQEDGDDYIVSGRWAWASGSANAATIGLGCRVATSDKPVVRLIVAPRDDIIFHDTWHTLGLCGTSSGDVELKQARIPKAHSYTITDTPWCDAPLYQMPYFGLLAAGVAAVALGNARAAMDDFLGFATQKTPQGGRTILAERSRVQSAFAQAQARWQAARCYYWQSLAALWHKANQPPAAASPVIDDNDKAALRLAATYAVRTSIDVVREIHDLAGGTSVYSKSPIQRRLRDGETMTQHMITNAATYEMVGRAMLVGATPQMQL